MARLETGRESVPTFAGVGVARKQVGVLHSNLFGWWCRQKLFDSIPQN